MSLFRWEEPLTLCRVVTDIYQVRTASSVVGTLRIQPSSWLGHSLWWPVLPSPGSVCEVPTFRLASDPGLSERRALPHLALAKSSPLDQAPPMLR